MGAKAGLQRYDPGMTIGKIAISLPVEQIELAKLAVAEGRATRVSAYISEALRLLEEDDSLDRLLDDMDAKYGQPSAETRARTEAFFAEVEKRYGRS